MKLYEKSYNREFNASCFKRFVRKIVQKRARRGAVIEQLYEKSYKRDPNASGCKRFVPKIVQTRETHGTVVGKQFCFGSVPLEAPRYTGYRPFKATTK